MRKYKYLQIGIASPEEIISWANPELQGKEFTYNPQKKDKVTYYNENGELVEYTLKGEVKKSETINYRTLKPEKDGLYCEVIFGPTKDYQCACGKSRKNVGDQKVCEKCGVELTESKVRRERMGYIALAAPVVHIWYLRNTPSKIAILLDMKTKDVLEVAALTSYIITEVSDPSIELVPGQVITEQEHSKKNREFFGKYKVKTGAEAIKFLLQRLDLGETISEIRAELKNATKQRREKLVKRLEIAEAFYHSNNKPEWMVMDVIPVIPPDLRPMVQLEGGRFATTDLNDLYRRIISRNIRLRRQIDSRSPEMIIKNEKRMLQEAVDSLIDNAKRKNKAALDKNRPLKSLSDILRGKQGRFRQNLLGKRVDYSGRSVIVIGPDLKMYQAGIPREMALILFKPFIINYLRQKDQAENQQAGDNQTALLSKDSKSSGVKRAKELIERGAPEAMEALEKVVVEHPVLLNRAPTLHRLSIQAFEPKLVEGKAIRLHPLVTTAFNADFDGDQMPVHVPLSDEAQAEARLLMLASKNILAPKDGKPVVTPSQDMIIGNYYLSIERSQIDREYHTFEDVYQAYLKYDIEFNNQIIVNDEIKYRDILALKNDVEKGLTPSVGKFFVPGREGKAFSSEDEVVHAYEKGDIDFHTRFVIPGHAIDKPFVHLDPNDPKYEEKVKLNESLKQQYLITTYGKMIFNQVFPENFVYVNEPTKDNLTKGTPLKYFVKRGENYKEIIKKAPLVEPFKKSMLSMSISEVFHQAKLAETSKTLDKMKDLGFKYSTVAGITVSAFDVVVAQEKDEIIAKAEETVKKYNQMYRRGTMLRTEKTRMVIEVWNNATREIEKSIKKRMQEDATKNHIFMMADSGARGSSSNFTQLAGMRGLMSKPNGESMEIPVKGCFIEGMSMSEFFISTHGARKGSTDTALKTAESGYLTRRLVDVSQDITITCSDCGTDKGMVIETLYNKDPKRTPNGYSKDNICVELKDRIIGRFAAKSVVGKVDGKKTTIVEKGEFITEDLAQKIVDAGIESVTVRTLLTCDAKVGVCVKCYGSDLSTTDIVEKGEVVGIVAAQSIGEPGTQLTMRTFHSGGVATSGDDITQGLPRIQELFEAREPKGKGVISEIKGVVKKVTIGTDNRTEIVVESPIEGNSKTYKTDAGKKAIVKEGDEIEAGDLLSEGLIHPKELLRVAPVDKVEKYILKEVQKVYRSTGVAISDKHVEIIVKQMLQKVVIIDEGDTELLPGSYISKAEIYKVIKDCLEKGKRIPSVKPVILGITRASLRADSFLAAASFQETTRVLTEAAIRGKVDTLDGLKENIIIGGLIPAGTGLIAEDDVEILEDPNAQLYDIKK